MATETERKFLVSGSGWRVDDPASYRQGYLNHDENRTVRVRLAGDEAFLTVKGLSRGASRAEFEYPIPPEDARELLALCVGAIVEKRRHVTEFGGLNWEVDEFLGDNAGLIVAEVELDDESQRIALPDWVGEEVTYEPRYFNSNLARHPFSRWKRE